jgi:hypothetical protein
MEKGREGDSSSTLPHVTVQNTRTNLNNLQYIYTLAGGSSHMCGPNVFERDLIWLHDRVTYILWVPNMSNGGCLHITSS